MWLVGCFVQHGPMVVGGASEIYLWTGHGSLFIVVPFSQRVQLASP